MLKRKVPLLKIQMSKNKKKNKERIVSSPRANSKIEDILKDYPEKLTAYPRAAFEEQLRNHLKKHKIK